MNTHPDRFVFVGGPGRSGTSHVARQLGSHPEVASFPDVELKLLTEKGGLLDLQHSLVEQYSPNRAGVAVQQFRRMAHAVLVGQYGQPALSTLVDDVTWTEVFERFVARLAPAGHPMPATQSTFNRCANRLLHEIAGLAAQRLAHPERRQLFLEKTPHSLLAAGFIEQLLPGSCYIHVMRDPRAIAFSLRRMRWGPDDLSACCAWVTSYCQTLQAHLERSPASFPSIQQVRIEDLANDPETGSLDMTYRLGITADPKLFAGASGDVLNAWQASCTESEQDVLNAELGELARAFGYDAEDIGARSSTDAESAVVELSGQ